MAFKKGEVYTCADAGCGCEITVTQGARRSKAEHQHLCCCGNTMVARSP